MAEKGIYSPFVRRIITVALFAGITGSFIALYHFAYLPQQRASYNLRTFRILDEIADNFSEGVKNNGIISYVYGYISKVNKEPKLTLNNLCSDSDIVFANKFNKSFIGDPAKIDSFSSFRHYKQISKKSFKEIIDPLISIHANAFNSVLLVKVTPDSIKRGGKNNSIYDSIIYDSAPTNIANINTDSLLENSKVEGANISDINIEGVKYKMFLMPFKIPAISNETFVMIGIISEESYREQTQNIPIGFLLTLGLILVFFLLVLPFIKIFILSLHENITIADVRVVIAVIFIIPFIITLLCSALWLNIYIKKYTNDVLSSLQKNVTDNFYKEISETIQQVKDYDSLIQNPREKLRKQNRLKEDILKSIPGIDTIDIKDYIFYPQHYKNIDNVHWMNAKGNDIASWRFINEPTAYFKLADREYFKDIRDYKGYVLPQPDFSNVKDTFSIQAIISRLTGEYTINVSMHSNVEIAQKKATAVAISTKMYSVYNTVTPPGFSYCLINESGNMIFHSDTTRNLRENLIEESADNHELLTAIKHKDSVVIDNIDLYDKPVKMMIKPLKSLPYYLVTYYHKRGQYLFTFHVVGFVFLCESILLLFVSLFSYCIMISSKRISKLFFIPGLLNSLKPSPHRVKFYTKNNLQLMTSVFFFSLFYWFISRENAYIYLLNCAVLLPLFAVTGYYMIKRGPAFIYLLHDRNNLHRRLIFKKKGFLCFWASIKNVLLLYMVSISFFAILQQVLFFNEFHANHKEVSLSIWTLIVLLPIIFFVIAGVDLDSIIANQKKNDGSINELKENNKSDKAGYVNYFIISLLLFVIVLSVIPTITLTAYAFHEEKKLNFQSLQLELAKRIQQRRTDINAKISHTKLSLIPGTAKSFREGLKFSSDKGLYLYNNILQPYDSILSVNSAEHSDSLRKKFFQDSLNNAFLSSPCYRIITRFLFLPPDHDEFYDGTSHNAFYHWEKTGDKKTGDSLQLHYNNFTDYVNPSSFSLTGNFFHFSLNDFLFYNYAGLFVLLSIVIFINLFYRLIYSVSKRIFLIGYFKNNVDKDNISGIQQDPEWLKQKYKSVNLYDFCKTFSITADKVCFAEIRRKERRLLKQKDGGEGILKMHIALLPVYENIWKDCSNVEKYTLYDFALDGFTNYKKILILYPLYKKGLLIKDEDDNLTLMTLSFRNFLITKETSEEIKIFSKEGKGSWATLRTVFYIIVVAVAAFIFISQEEASKRLITIVTSLGALLPAMLKLFDKSTFTSSGNKSSQ